MPAVRINPQRLIEAARDLAKDAGTSRPKTVYLRRAVSSAYYALFHFMTQELAKHLLPDATDADRLRATRSVGHDQLDTVCGWIRSTQKDVGPEHCRPLIDSLRKTKMVDVAAVFCDLQEARHRADYDHLADFTKAATLGYVQDAEQAMKTWSTIGKKHRQAFLTLVALKSGIK